MKDDLSEDLIKETHCILTMGIPTIHRNNTITTSEQYGGIYRAVIVGAGGCNFSTPRFVPVHMKDLCRSLKEDIDSAEKNQSIDPVSLASECSLGFVEFHPFQDGNGRMCRMILNAILCRYIGVIVPIGEDEDERKEYMAIKVRASQECEAFCAQESRAEGPDTEEEINRQKPPRLAELSGVISSAARTEYPVEQLIHPFPFVLLSREVSGTSSLLCTTINNTHSLLRPRSEMSGVNQSQAGGQGSKPGDFEAVRKSVIDLLKQPDYDDGSAGPVLVRLAWHSAGTYDVETDTGGSNGAGMRYEAEGGDPANAGLQNARLFLEPVKRQHPWITYSDLWTLAGVTAIRAMGGPEVSWRPGRTDYVDDSKLPPRGRLPDAAQGAAHIRAVFYRMGFGDREIVALSGAHNLGRCHAGNSGFEGKWVNNPTRFSNQYFRLLLSEEWTEKTVPESGALQFASVDPVTEEELMMLPTDIALTTDPEFAKYVRMYAEDKALFFEDFSRAFAKLMELGIRRDAEGRVTNTDNEKGGYRSAPKKSESAAPVQDDASRTGGCPVAHHKARL
ncbi:uncharacterized protein E0L32_002346 [Thyridium curvatum]|uniref:Peroxidase n=1 Tax=Thyridium curvatum TaxID=1093900 RepID=A0A507ARP2_9PEZI|nr:uncharacterized protein E0L32_002346 [Thyridium curvatum]TPX06850.1 hypothetical protein E0L32_002346 [Thyridium curvatum]